MKENKQLAPIVIFVYNRPIHLYRTISALQNNIYANGSDLHIFSDGPKNDIVQQQVNDVRQYIRTISGFKSITIYESEKNNGLANAVIAGVTQIINKFGRAIVLEDDLITSPYFLTYMNEALNMYQENSDVYAISGYQYNIKGRLKSTSFISFGESIGWATWQRAWNDFESNGQMLLAEIENRNLRYKFDFDGSYHFCKMLEDQIKGLNSSWAIRWCATIFLKNKLMLVPAKSLINHIGSDGSGTNVGVSEFFETPLADKPIRVKKQYPKESTQLRNLWIKYFKGENEDKTFKQKLKSFLPEIIFKIFRKLKSI